MLARCGITFMKQNKQSLEEKMRQVSAMQSPPPTVEEVNRLKARVSELESALKNRGLKILELEKEKQSRLVAKNHFRMAQAEAVLSGWPMKFLRAWQRRWVNSSGVRARKSQNQSALTRSQSRSIGLKSGE